MANEIVAQAAAHPAMIGAAPHEGTAATLLGQMRAVMAGTLLAGIAAVRRARTPAATAAQARPAAAQHHVGTHEAVRDVTIVRTPAVNPGPTAAAILAPIAAGTLEARRAATVPAAKAVTRASVRSRVARQVVLASPGRVSPFPASRRRKPR